MVSTALFYQHPPIYRRMEEYAGLPTQRPLEANFPLPSSPVSLDELVFWIVPRSGPVTVGFPVVFPLTPEWKLDTPPFKEWVLYDLQQGGGNVGGTIRFMRTLDGGRHGLSVWTVGPQTTPLGIRRIDGILGAAQTFIVDLFTRTAALEAETTRLAGLVSRYHDGVVNYYKGGTTTAYTSDALADHGDTAHAVLSDPDGSVSAQAYQWQSSPPADANGEFNWTDISGANAQSYAITLGDVNTVLRCGVSYNDATGTAEETFGGPLGMTSGIRSPGFFILGAIVDLASLNATWIASVLTGAQRPGVADVMPPAPDNDISFFTPGSLAPSGLVFGGNLQLVILQMAEVADLTDVLARLPGQAEASIFSDLTLNEDHITYDGIVYNVWISGTNTYSVSQLNAANFVFER